MMGAVAHAVSSLYTFHRLKRRHFFRAFSYFSLPTLPFTLSFKRESTSEREKIQSSERSKSLLKLMMRFFFGCYCEWRCAASAIERCAQNTVSLNFCSMNCNFCVYRHHLYYSYILARTCTHSLAQHKPYLFTYSCEYFAYCCFFHNFFFSSMIRSLSCWNQEENHFESHHLHQIQRTDKWFA